MSRVLDRMAGRDITLDALPPAAISVSDGRPGWRFLWHSTVFGTAEGLRLHLPDFVWLMVVALPAGAIAHLIFGISATYVLGAAATGALGRSVTRATRSR